MHRLILAVSVFVAAAISSPALAFEVCDEPQNDRFEYSRQLEQNIPLDLPSGHYEQVLKTEFSTRSGFAFFPYANWTPTRHIVGIPLDFITFLCRATFVGHMANIRFHTGSVWDDAATAVLQEASINAATCLEEARGKFVACLPRFGDDLAAGLRDYHARLTEEDKAFASLLFRTALTQIIRREYAHVFRGHLGTRMETAPFPADAVFEADFFRPFNQRDRLHADQGPGSIP
jgi:hypothetical protein